MADELCLSHERRPPPRASTLHSRSRAATRYSAITKPAWRPWGRDNGKPGERRYHPGNYAAFLLDPDGNNIEAVHHGPASGARPRSVITLRPPLKGVTVPAPETRSASFPPLS